MRKEKNRLMRVTSVIVVLLILVGISIIPLTDGITVEKHDLDSVKAILREPNFEGQSTIQETPPAWGYGLIYMHVEEVSISSSGVEYSNLPGVDVRAFRLSFTPEKYTSVTDKDGKCLLYALLAGIYIIKVSADGYKDISSGFKKFRITVISPGEIENLHFTMVKKNRTIT